MAVGICGACGTWDRLYKSRGDGALVCMECLPATLEEVGVEEGNRDLIDVWDDDGRDSVWSTDIKSIPTDCILEVIADNWKCPAFMKYHPGYPGDEHVDGSIGPIPHLEYLEEYIADYACGGVCFDELDLYPGLRWRKARKW